MLFLQVFYDYVVRFDKGRISAKHIECRQVNQSTLIKECFRCLHQNVKRKEWFETDLYFSLFREATFVLSLL